MALSAIARDSIYEINMVRGESAFAAGSLAKTASGLTRLGSRAFSPYRRNFEHAYLRTMAVGEMATVRLLLMRKEELSLNLGRPILDSLWNLIDGGRTQTWKGRKELWKGFVPTIDFGTSRWGDLQIAAEVRNVIAHHNGELSGKRLKDRVAFAERVRTVKVGLQGTRLIISSESVEYCHGIVEDFVRWLDMA